MPDEVCKSHGSITNMGGDSTNNNNNSPQTEGNNNITLLPLLI